jgi:uncharacterized membrane protein YbhN (UPF0104 family)
MQNGPPSIRRRVASLPTLVSLALAAAFLAFLLTRFDVDLAASWQQVKSSNPWYLVLACVVHYTTFAFRGARWRLLLHNAQGRPQAPPGVLYCSQLVLLGWFVNSVVWFRLGDAYRAYLYRYDGGVGRKHRGGWPKATNGSGKAWSEVSGSYPWWRSGECWAGWRRYTGSTWWRQPWE